MSEASRSFEFSIAYQRSVLHRILQDKKYAVKAMQLLREDLFDSNSIKWIFRKIKNGHASVRVLKDELKAEANLDPTLVKAIVQDLIIFLRPFDRDESDYAIENLRKNIDTQKISTILLQAAGEVRSGAHPDAVRKTISLAFFSATTENITVDPIGSYQSRFAERQAKAESGEEIFVSSGFKNIDDDIGGPKLGQFWVYFGDTNVGKSQAAVSVGAENLFKGFKVIHFSLEDLIDITLARYDARFTRLLYDNLSVGRISEREKETVDKIFSLLRQKREKHLWVSKIEEGSTINELYAEYRRLQIQENFYPQVVIIDSVHDMDPDSRVESYRVGWRRIYKSIRRFTQKENIATIAFDQSNQEKKKGEVRGTEAASESYDKSRIVDGFITMNQSKIQKKDGIINLWTAKMKDREKHRSYLQRGNFKISRYVSIQRGEQV